MNLKQVCHPLFQYICKLYKRQEAGEVLSEEKVKNEILHCFELLHDAVLGNTILADQLEKVELPLIFFVDYIIKEGPFSFSKSWLELARNFNELSGDEKFFDILDETLADPSPSATERIGIFYTCITLGFYGSYSGDMYNLERKLKVCALRIGLDNIAIARQPFGNSVYVNISKENKFKSPGYSTKPLVVVALIFLIASIVTNIILFRHIVLPVSNDFIRTINNSISKDKYNSPAFLQFKIAEDGKYIPINKSSHNTKQKLLYPKNQIQNSSWFQAYQAGAQLKKSYNIKKDNSSKSKKENSTIQQVNPIKKHNNEELN